MEEFLAKQAEEEQRAAREVAAAQRQREKRRRREHQELKAQIGAQRERVRAARLANSGNASHCARQFFKADFLAMDARDRAAALEHGDDLPGRRRREAAAAARRRARERAAWAARRAAAAASGAAATAAACARAVAVLGAVHGESHAQRQQQLDQMSRLVRGLGCAVSATAPLSRHQQQRRPPLPKLILEQREAAAAAAAGGGGGGGGGGELARRTRLRPSPRQRDTGPPLPGGPSQFGLAESLTRRAIAVDAARQEALEGADRHAVQRTLGPLEDLDVEVVLGMEELRQRQQQQDEEEEEEKDGEEERTDGAPLRNHFEQSLPPYAKEGTSVRVPPTLLPTGDAAGGGEALFLHRRRFDLRAKQRRRELVHATAQREQKLEDARWGVSLHDPTNTELEHEDHVLDGLMGARGD